MAEKKHENPAVPSELSVEQICFGLDRPLDEQSLIAFLENLAAPGLLHALVPRLTDEEILAVVDFLTGLMKKHLSHEEYHRLFLAGPQF